jgi:L-iditol 2-dehydrogenase
MCHSICRKARFTRLNTPSPIEEILVLSARLHGPRDLRVDEIPDPGHPGPGEVHLRVRAVGICGSDLHVYREPKPMSGILKNPLIPGHEFAGVIEEAGPDALDGAGKELTPGLRVAVDPAQSCGHCEMCEQGHPNLCLHLRFCSQFPDQGALRERMIVPSRTCFVLPDDIDFASAALLEPLGVAIHAVTLSHLKSNDTVSIHGAGPIGLLILQMATVHGARRVFVAEQLPWRLALAERMGAEPLDPARGTAADQIMEMTHGRGVDVAFEAGWAGELVQHAADSVRHGGRVVLVGIPEDDRLTVRHSTVRRKGLTLVLCRRMKHTYPQACDLVRKNRVDVRTMVTHRFPLHRSPEAFALNDRYADGVVKIIVEMP